jgi:hypothetical protein
MLVPPPERGEKVVVQRNKTYPFQIMAPSFFCRARRATEGPKYLIWALRAQNKQARDQALKRIGFISLSCSGRLLVNHLRFPPCPARLLYLEQFPMKLACAVHPRLSQQEQLDVVAQLFQANPCCLDADFSVKIKEQIRDEQELMSDKLFLAALKLWAERTKLTNMHIERLLAGLRKNVSNYHGNKTTSAENLFSARFLGQLLTNHRSAGGEDPRCTTRRQLIDSGAPILAAPKQTDEKKSKPASGYVVFLNHLAQQKKEELHVTRMTKQQYLQVIGREAPGSIPAACLLPRPTVTFLLFGLFPGSGPAHCVCGC